MKEIKPELIEAFQDIMCPLLVDEHKLCSIENCDCPLIEYEYKNGKRKVKGFSFPINCPAKEGVIIKI